MVSIFDLVKGATVKTIDLTNPTNLEILKAKKETPIVMVGSLSQVNITFTLKSRDEAKEFFESFQTPPDQPETFKADPKDKGTR